MIPLVMPSRLAAAWLLALPSLTRGEGRSLPAHPQLEVARSAALAAARALRSPGGTAALARAQLEQALSYSERGRWVWHADPLTIALSLLEEGEPVIGLVLSVDGGEMIAGAVDAGVHLLSENGSRREGEFTSGGASMFANVLHLPPEGQWCAQLDECIHHLQTTGTGMPLQLVRKSGGSYCEGLLDVVLSRADVHLAPPAAFLPRQPIPPVPVLCAFQLLLDESGGSLSDAYGEPLDLLGALADTDGSGQSKAGEQGLMRRGILAGHEVMIPYFCRATKASFPISELDGSITLPPLVLEGSFRQRLNAFAANYTLESLDGEESMQQVADDGEDDPVFRLRGGYRSSDVLPQRVQRP